MAYQINTNDNGDETPPSSQTVSKSQQHYESNGNDLKLILCMAIGLTDEDGEIFGDVGKDERFPKKNKNQFKPSNAHLVDEIRRRKKLNDPSQEPRVNSQMKKADAIEWLQKNPLKDPADTAFILSKMII